MKRAPLRQSASSIKKVKASESSRPRDKALFIFRRDLRMHDNTALLECMKRYRVCPIFIFTPEQVGKNNYKSENAVQFMVQSLEDLSAAIANSGGTLNTFFGDIREVITELAKANDIKAVYVNKDYSPYSHKRDKAIEALCVKLSIEFHSYHDILLTDGLDAIKSKEGKPYYLFAHFFNQAKKMNVRKPKYVAMESWGKLQKSGYLLDDFKSYLLQHAHYHENPHLALRGGRKEALNSLENNLQRWKKYAKTKDEAHNEQGSTRLSPHLKFGTVSVRELYFHFAGAYGDHCDLNRQLYWRDFFYYLAHWFPETLEGGPIPSKMRYKGIQWQQNDEWLARWKSGTTGIPIVDAGMRELVKTGYMHNRARMVVAHFLTKDLLINWREGERFFAQHLVDIDWCQNSGNWHWCDGTGADGSPWLRIFNPWTQQAKIDAECRYIKRYIPELKDVPVQSIHKWAEHWDSFPESGYPQPMVDHQERKKVCLLAYGEKVKENVGK